MIGKIYREKFILRQHLRSKPQTVFLFGDNMQGTGYKGQAAHMRGEPNAIGIPIKWSPSNAEGSFFSDEDFPRIKEYIDTAFHRVRKFRDQGFDVVIPQDGLETGVARLSTKALVIHKYIEEKISELEKDGEQ
jgi:hypothetical protein